MNRSTKFTLAAVAALGLATITAPVVAQPGAHDMGRHGGPGNMAGMMETMMGGAMGMMMGGSQRHAMTMFDTDDDGTLSSEEMAAGIQAELTTYDKDADGTLSLEEFAAMHAAHTRPMMVRAFQMHDADGDAQVTEDEMAAMAAMMRSHMGGQQDGMQGMGPGMMDGN